MASALICPGAALNLLALTDREVNLLHQLLTHHLGDPGAPDDAIVSLIRAVNSFKTTGSEHRKRGGEHYAENLWVFPIYPVGMSLKEIVATPPADNPASE